MEVAGGLNPFAIEAPSPEIIHRGHVRVYELSQQLNSFDSDLFSSGDSLRQLRLRIAELLLTTNTAEQLRKARKAVRDVGAVEAAHLANRLRGVADNEAMKRQFVLDFAFLLQVILQLPSIGSELRRRTEEYLQALMIDLTRAA